MHNNVIVQELHACMNDAAALVLDCLYVKVVYFLYNFCRAMRCISAAYAVMRCLCVCVCVSVCVSVTFVSCVKIAPPRLVRKN